MEHTMSLSSQGMESDKRQRPEYLHANLGGKISIKQIHTHTDLMIKFMTLVTCSNSVIDSIYKYHSIVMKLFPMYTVFW